MLNKRLCKNGDSFGKGVIEGVAASESANNAAAAGAFAPLLSLGIPGSGTTAVLLGGLLLWGLKPGPLLFRQEPDFVWSLISSMYIGNLICIAIAIAMIPFVVHILRIPGGVMAPVIMTLCIVGSYSVNNNMFDVYVMLIAGTFAYVFQSLKYPLAPFLLSFVLTPRLETSFTQAFQISHGSVAIFFTSPISLFLLLCLALMVSFPLFKKYAFVKK
jgi:putative tricarboxylic transport membrane protein